MMPITPLHPGLPMLIALHAPRNVELASALLGSVLIDIEFFLYLMFGTPIHGVLHSFLIAAILGLAIVPIIFLMRKSLTKLKKQFGLDHHMNVGPIAAGALIGTESHVLLDSIIYGDMNPFYPLTGNVVYIGIPYMFWIIYLISTLSTVILLTFLIRCLSHLDPAGDKIQ